MDNIPIISGTIINVSLRPDSLTPHLKKKPIDALCELIWNALDADATEININFVKGLLPNSLDRIEIIDNGEGLTYEKARRVFQNFGESEKARKLTSALGRKYHGKLGQGRYKAMSLGHQAEWHWFDYQKQQRFYVELSESCLTKPKIFDGESKLPANYHQGGLVHISSIKNTVMLDTLFSPEKIEELKERFSLYLERHTGIRIFINGKNLSFANLKRKTIELNNFAPIEYEENCYQIKCKIVQWTHGLAANSKIFLCSDDGIPLNELPLQFRPSFPLTAFICSKYIELLDTDGKILLCELEENFQTLIREVRKQLKELDASLAEEQAEHVVSVLKTSNIYPYQREPLNNIQKQERKIFDQVSTQVFYHAKEWNGANNKQKSFILKMIKGIVESGPSNLMNVLEEVITLPKDKIDEFNETIKESSVVNIIDTVKEVQNRIKVIYGLRHMHNDKATKKAVQEKKHLHKILDHELWLFGEEFRFSVSEAKLNAVMQRHIGLLDRECLVPDELVDDLSRIDIGLIGRQMAVGRPGYFRNLIVEIKRPSKKIGKKEYDQIEEYMYKLTDQKESFNPEKTEWDFLLLAGDVDDHVERRMRQNGRSYGHCHMSVGGKINLYVRRWNEFLDEGMEKLEFVKKRLEIGLEQESDGFKYIDKKYKILNE
jgi:hypothetical protein